MNKYLFFIIFFSYSLLASAQSRGGEIMRSQQKKSAKVTKPRSTQIKKRRTSSKRTATYNQNDVDEVETDVDISPEQFFQWGEEDFYNKNYSEAKEWYEIAAMEGHTQAQYYLGWMYQFGRGCTKEIDAAIYWYSKAVENKHLKAARNLSLIFLYEKEYYISAFVNAKKAAEWGDTIATALLGYLYMTGTGAVENKVKAKQCFDNSIPLLYNKGISLAFKNISEGDAILYLAYTLWDTNGKYYGRACMHIGWIYYKGLNGNEVDYTEAFKFFNEASDNGNNVGKYLLGECYEYGRGTQIDKKKAKQYYKESNLTSKTAYLLANSTNY